MKKEIKIKGMTCSHCQARVENTLKNISGVKDAKVKLKDELAIVKLEEPVSNEVFINAITDAGYEVVSISDKKGLLD